MITQRIWGLTLFAEKKEIFLKDVKTICSMIFWNKPQIRKSVSSLPKTIRFSAFLRLAHRAPNEMQFQALVIGELCIRLLWGLTGGFELPEDHEGLSLGLVG